MKLLILLFRRCCVFLTYRRSPKSNFELEMVRERKFIKLILLQPKNIGIVHKIFIRKLISHGHSPWTCLSDLSVFSRSCSLVKESLCPSVSRPFFVATVPALSFLQVVHACITLETKAEQPMTQ